MGELVPFESFESALTGKKLVAKFNQTRFDKEMRWAIEREYALRLLRGNEPLRRCDPTSVQVAMMEVADSALSLAPHTGHAYLIPWEGQCVFTPGYRGLGYLSQHGGAVTSINSAHVYARDRFAVGVRNNRRFVEHEENWQVTDRGALLAVYTIATLASGEERIDVTPQRVLAAAQKAATARNAKGGMAWRGDFRDQMELKVSIRRCLKMVPLDGAGWVAHALHVANKHDNVDFDVIKDDAPPDGELCVTEDDVQRIHAWLTDRNLPASKWMGGMAEAFGVRDLNNLPASRLPELWSRMEARYEQMSRG